MDAASALQSALSPQGPEAAAIASLTWVLVAGAFAVLALVTLLTILAVRAPRPWLGRNAAIVAGGIVFPGVVLFALLGYASLAVPRHAAAVPALRVEVVGRQWWWEVTYLDGSGARDFLTANEIRIPVGQPVELRLASADVIHSFWVPSLAGKLDMIPGRSNVLRISADTEGIYRGQCAEYCGGPHALMGLHVVAEPTARFEAWRASQRLPAAADSREGRAIFEATCGGCHTVRGTAAAGRLGPDLTHVASRLALAAATLPNNAESRARWIARGQHVKPGNLMPAYPDLAPAEAAALAQYLASLR
jgi:cytochrome c oxidase subunit II